MKRIFSILLLFLFTAGMIYSEKIAAFPEIKKPQSLDVDKDRAYVVEGAEVFVYSLKNFKLLAKFGKRGEGPQEFRISPTGRVVVHPLGDYLYISSMGKMSKFTRDGKYISEVITPTGENYKPLWHNKFVGAGVISEDGTMYRTIDFYNENMVKGKTVFKHIHSEQKSGSINVFATARVYRTYDKKLFVTGREGLAIDVFDIDDII